MITRQQCADQFDYDSLALEHLNLYLTSRLWWDADQDLDSLMADYFTNYYGPAAKPMQAFAEFSEANWMQMGHDGDKIGEAFTLLEAARSAADPQSPPGRRIQKIADLMKPMRALQKQLSRKRDTDLSYRILETNQSGGKPMKDKTFDGDVLKEYWADVRTAPLLKLTPEAPKPKAGTSFQIQREGSILHFGIVCKEPDMAGLNIATTASDDPQLLEGDHITLLIETASNSYYEIAINPAGAVLEIDHGEKGPGIKWTSGARVAVHRGEKQWSIEMRLPITAEGSRMIDPLKGIDGSQPKDLFPWHFNLCRQRVRGTDVERTAWSATGRDDFYVPEKFAKMWGK